MPLAGIDAALVFVLLAVQPIRRAHRLFDGADPIHRGTDVPVAVQEQDRPRRQQGHDRLGVEVVQQLRHEIVNAVRLQRFVLDEVLVTRQAGDGHAGLDALVQRHQPPRAGRPHAHAGDADPARVHFGARGQVVQRHQVIAQHHAPERAPDPQIELAGGHFAVRSLFGGTAWPPPVSLAEAIGVYGQDDKSTPRQGRPRRLRRVFGLEQLFLADVVLAAVPVAIEDGRRLPRRVFRLQQVARHSGPRAVVELELLHHAIAPVLPGECLDLGPLRARRQLAQQLPKLRPHLLALLLPCSPGGGHDEGPGDLRLRQPAGRIGLVGLGHQDVRRKTKQCAQP